MESLRCPSVMRVSRKEPESSGSSVLDSGGHFLDNFLILLGFF